MGGMNTYTKKGETRPAVSWRCQAILRCRRVQPVAKPDSGIEQARHLSPPFSCAAAGSGRLFLLLSA